MSNKTYDTLRFIALAVGPVATFISAVLAIWQVPYTEQITATLAALCTLLSAFVEIARRLYNKTQEPEGLDDDVEEDGEESEG